MVVIVRVANAISITSHATISWHCLNATANLAISGMCKLTKKIGICQASFAFQRFFYAHALLYPPAEKVVVLSLVKHLKSTSSAVVLVVRARARQNATPRQEKFAPTPTRHPAN